MPMNRNQRIKKHTQCSPFVWSHTNKPTPLKQLIAHFVFYRSVNCACKWNNAHKFCRFRGIKEKQHSYTQTFTFTCAGSYRMYSLPTIIWHYRKTSKMKTINCMAAHKLFLFALSAKSYTLVQTNSLWLLDTVAKLCYRILAWWRCVCMVVAEWSLVPCGACECEWETFAVCISRANDTNSRNCIITAERAVDICQTVHKIFRKWQTFYWTALWVCWCV